MAKHFVEQNKTYGRQSLVNLINQKGHEKPVKEAYERYVAEAKYSLSLLKIQVTDAFNSLTFPM